MHEVCLCDIALVTESDELAESNVVGVCPVEHGGSDCSGLGEDGQASCLGHLLCEGDVDTVLGVHVTETVGSEDPDSVFLCLCDELFLELCSLGTVLLESCGEDDRILDSCCFEVVKLGDDECILDDDDCEVDGLSDVNDALVCGDALDRLFLGVDGIQVVQVESCVDEVGDDHSTDLRCIVGCTDDSDRFWVKETFHKSDILLYSYKV